MTFQAVSGRPTRSDLWDSAAEAAMGHIELARWAQIVLIAPASADFMARLGAGRADDLLATLCLATEAPIAARAGDEPRHVGQQGDAGQCRQRWPRAAFASWAPRPAIRPAAKSAPGACGSRCSWPNRCSSRRPMPVCWRGLNVLITAGPTRERLDPVRYLTNRSSGKMGFAVAEAAREAGAHVTLVSGPVQLPTPPGITRINVESARDMYAAVHRQVAEADIFIAAAAVADFQPVSVAKQKIKKQGGSVKLDLEPAPDIIKSVADMAKRPFVVGFAAETNDVEENARIKLKRKRST